MNEDIREIIRRELPILLTQDPQIRDWVWHLVHDYAPSRIETESRFEQILAEIRAMREESERRWQENQRKWEENQRKWKENQRQLQAMQEEGQRRWEENQSQIRALLEEIKRLDHRIDRTLGAIGARWGVSTENSFCDALRAILEESFGVMVEQVRYWDESGEVLSHPDQVELDVIIRNGELLACEIKSAASRADIHAFERKVRSYENRTNRKIHRMLLISPMVRKKDRELADKLGIEVYSDAEDVTLGEEPMA
ncbi:MAG: DUF3782 domain-containing protein [Anaerolineales bacterium]|nr:DUF3782 domain-containing protein [Anaerolineales bacterium]MDW8446033.1 DUF3782 domain-containing protein [Anaerolineales bacterium]